MEDHFKVQLLLAKQRSEMLKSEVIRCKNAAGNSGFRRFKARDLSEYNSIIIRFARILIKMGKTLESKEINKLNKRALI